MIKRWNILPDAGAEAQVLAKALGVSDVLARLLWNRGLLTVDDAQRFLDPEHLQDFYDPFLMKDMKEAVARIAKAIELGATEGITSISPENPYSYNNFLILNFEIVDRRELYGGKDRYLLRKEF